MTKYNRTKFPVCFRHMTKYEIEKDTKIREQLCGYLIPTKLYRLDKRIVQLYNYDLEYPKQYGLEEAHYHLLIFDQSLLKIEGILKLIREER
jgi:hypothetical protein